MGALKWSSLRKRNTMMRDNHTNQIADREHILRTKMKKSDLAIVVITQHIIF